MTKTNKYECHLFGNQFSDPVPFWQAHILCAESPRVLAANAEQISLRRAARAEGATAIQIRAIQIMLDG